MAKKIKISFGKGNGEEPKEAPQEEMQEQAQAVDQTGQHVELVQGALKALDAGDIESAKAMLQQLLSGEKSEMAPGSKESLSNGVDKIFNKG